MDISYLARYGLAALVTICVGAAGLLLYSELNRPIQQIRIEGQLSEAERALLSDALEQYSDARILSAQLQDLVDDINGLGWPQNVSVRRQWPDTLILRIQKQGVIAHWNRDRYLTSNGRVIDQADVVADLPRLVVQNVEPEAALGTLQQLDEMARMHGLRIAELHHDVTAGWWLRQRDGVRVNLGRSEPESPLQQRYGRFLRVRAQLPQPQLAALEYADVRYTNGVALKSAAEQETQSTNTAAQPLLVGQAASTRTLMDER